MSYPELERGIRETLMDGVPIIAHPLALNRERRFDEVRQRVLTRYYISAGAGGIAIGVHTTQFKVHETNLYDELLKITGETIFECEKSVGRRIVRVAGVVGPLERAIREARLARDLGYHAALVSIHHLRGADYDAIIEYIKKVSREIPVFGFYLQPAVGGMKLSYDFWLKLFNNVENIVAVKVAPFNRYYTLDVVRALVDSERERDIALYTGNDDSIIIDLVSTYSVKRRGEYVNVRIVGGLLGHWAFWTKRSMEIFEYVKSIRSSSSIPRELLILAHQVTDVNGAIFDAFNDFKGCIPGIHEVLKRSGLLDTNLTLDPSETLSPGQLEEINRVYNAYPHLRDDLFITRYMMDWLDGKCAGYEFRVPRIEDIFKPTYALPTAMT
jgi:hypothetical protein